MLNLLKLHILLILALACYAQSLGDHSQDICVNLPGGYPSSATALSANALQSKTSSNCVEVFSVNLDDSTFKGKYVLIEIRITLPNNINYTPVLLGKKGSAPGIDTSSSTANRYEAIDNSGYANIKSYQYISLTNDYTTSGGIYYLAFYRTDTNITDQFYSGSVQFNIQAKSSSSFQCPNDCTQQGTCVPNNQQCVCNTDYFDTDCSVKATQISVPNSASATAAPRHWVYFYITLSDLGKALDLTFSEASASEVDAYYNILDTSSYILPSVSALDWWTLTSGDSTLGVEVSRSAQQSYSGRNLIYGFQNTDTANTITVSYSASLAKDSTSTIMVVIIVILAVLIVLTAIIAMIKLRTMRRLREQYLQNQRHIAASAPQFLTIEEIDEHFPNREYGKINNHFQNSCSICLEEYQPQTLCRQLYCGHVFHGVCIEEWLKKHEKCPNCNKIMNMQAINEFKNNPNAASESTSPILQDNSSNVNIGLQQQQPQVPYQSQPQLQPQRRSVDLDPVVVHVHSENNLDRRGIEYAPPQYGAEHYANHMPAQQNGTNMPSDAEVAYRNGFNNNNNA